MTGSVQPVSVEVWIEMYSAHDLLRSVHCIGDKRIELVTANSVHFSARHLHNAEQKRAILIKYQKDVKCEQPFKDIGNMQTFSVNGGCLFSNHLRVVHTVWLQLRFLSQQIGSMRFNVSVHTVQFRLRN